MIDPIKDMLDVHAEHYKSVGDYSVTTLLNPPRYVHLLKRHCHEKQLNYDNMFPSFLGTAIHAYVEHCLNASVRSYRLEDRIVYTMRDRVISGAFDILTADNEIYDIKSCKTWKKVFDPEYKEWHEQQNMYAYLLYLTEGIQVRSLNIAAIYMDWVASKAARDRSYPQAQKEYITLEMWPLEQTEALMHERIDLMKAHENTPDDDLPECTIEERFEDPLQFACMKTETAARATRVCDTLAEAIQVMRTTKGFGAGSYIEVRHAVRKRCERYCEINGYCNVYKRYMAAKTNKTLAEIIPYEQI